MSSTEKYRKGHRAYQRGRWAERLTLWLLWLRGWAWVAERIQVGRFEMDLLMSRGAELRLLEVKYRRPGSWTTADMALSYGQRQRLQQALQHYLDRVPWPGQVSFQRVSWAGWQCRFHPPERWDSLKMSRGED